jgi:hypothetical protein
MQRLLCCLLSLIALAGHAESAKPLLKAGSWESFYYSEKGGKVCYMASQPSNGKSQGKAFLTITHRTADKSIGVISVTQGFAYRKDAPPSIEIGSSKFDLYSDGDTAWSRNDKAVMAAALKAKTLVVHGSPGKGQSVSDSYLLDGFAKAYGAISQACGVS